MSLEERKEVERTCVRALESLDGQLQGEYFPLAGSESYSPKQGMSPEDEARLSKLGMLFEAPDSTLRLCTGAGRHWPHARGAFLSKSETFTAWVNEQEHLRLVATQPGAQLKKAFAEFVSASDGVASAIRRERPERHASQASPRQ